jgi:hypothetical protein
MGVDETIRRVAVAAGVGSLLILAATAAVLVIQGLRGAPTTPPAYEVGQQVDLPSDLYDGRAHTLVIFARSSCAVCQRVKPFLVDLTAEARGASAMRTVVLTSGRDRPEELEFAESIGVPEFDVENRPSGLRLHTVPTVLVVDRAGRILLALEGEPQTDHAAEEILRGIRRLTARAGQLP